MDKFLSLLVVALMTIFLAPILGVFFGAFSGWVVGFVFENAIRSTLASWGVNPSVSMWQLGATLGFFGAFFRTATGGSK